MVTDPSDVQERAWVEHREPATSPVENPIWVAEDPETECLGVGNVEAEAIGNLVAVVAEWESENQKADPMMKLPGQVVTRPSMKGSLSDSMFESIRSLF